MRKLIGVAFLAIGVTGCVSLTPEGQRVRITNNPDVVRGCEFVGNLRSGSMLGGGTGEERAQVDMQNETARLGGNVLFLTSSHGGPNLGAGAWSAGEAYRCTAGGA
jgi:hypothetical protein